MRPWLLVPLLLCVSPVFAQESVRLRSIPRTFVLDEIQIWKSPVQKNSYTSKGVKKYVIPFLAITAGLLATDRKIDDQLPNTLDQQKWSGRVSQFGASYSLAGYAGATYLLGRLRGDERMRETGLIALEALAHTQVVVFVGKQVTNRERPVDHQGGLSFWEGGNSFPSGHAASAFTVATVYAYEYGPRHKMVPVIAYSMAGLVSASRMTARRHWMSDIFVGGSAGFLIGRYVYKKRHDRRLDGGGPTGWNRAVPNIGVGGRQVDLSWQW